LLAPVLADSVPTSVPEIVASIMHDDNADTAVALLGQTEVQDRVRAEDPAEFVSVFRHAAELKDMEQLMTSPASQAAMRLALMSRDGCRFCQDSARIQNWAAHDSRIPDSVRQALPTIFLDWPTLTPPQRASVSALGVTEASWGKLALDGRRDKLEAWCKKEFADLLKMNPSTIDELKEMRRRKIMLWSIGGDDAVQPVQDRYEQAAVAVEKLQQARAMLKANPSSNPAVLRALQAAENARDPAARLTALSQLFDGLGQPDPSVLAAAPAGAGQVFDDQSRRVTADLVRTGVLREIQDTWASADFSAFYSAHPDKRPFNIVVAPMGRSSIAEYNHDVLTFNEKYIEDFVKVRGKTIADLATDPTLLQSLIRETAPTFVHEATHQIQDTWAQEHQIPFEWGEGVEKEALTVEALYVLQKLRIDPGYLAYVSANIEHSDLLQEDVTRAATLKQHGADWFGVQEMASDYAGFPSIASFAWTSIAARQDFAATLKEELARRAKLASPQRQRLAAQRDFKNKYASPKEMLDDIPNVNDEALNRVMTELLSIDGQEPAIYNAYQGRLNGVNTRADGHLQELANPTHDPVPPPGS